MEEAPQETREEIELIVNQLEDFKVEEEPTPKVEPKKKARASKPKVIKNEDVNFETQPEETPPTKKRVRTPVKQPMITKEDIAQEVIKEIVDEVKKAW